MATVTVKGIPTSVYRRLKHVALTNRRSVNREIIARLERSLHDRAVSADEVLAAARELRGRMGGLWVTDKDVAEAKAAGRP
jgi:hypothetical protein